MKTFFFSTALALLVLLPATAASRSSASYSVPADIIDAGGKRLASVSYVIDASLGGIGGISTAAAPASLAKHSYAGQLFDASVLVVSASPTNVNEGATRQINAALQNDDGTSNTLAGVQVAWSVLDGPIGSINFSGLATAGRVYQDTPASVRGAFAGRTAALGLLVRNTDPDNFDSYAGDGLDDGWQVQYFGMGNPEALAGADPDGDGQTNGFEYIAGTVPTDATSRFRLGIAEVSASRKDIIFLPRLASRTYSVEYAISPAGGFGPLTGATTTDFGPTRTVRDLNATNEARFYRVSISFP